MKVTMQREQGITENGNEINNRWVLRDQNGVILDIDQYQNDLVPRWKAKGYVIEKKGH